MQAVHAKSRDNVLRDRKDQWIKDQHIKRSAFKEVTSLKTWPLQELALKDYNALVQVYLNTDDKKDKPGVVKNSDGLLLPDHQYGDSSSSCNSTDKKRSMKDKASSPGKSQQKHSYREGFLEERRIPAHNVVPTKISDEDDGETTTTILYPAHKFDTSGLWSMEPRVFSVEKANGKRKYLVGHLGRVMDFMWRKTDRCSRYFYEMILEKTPCRLYFDLEFSIPDNPNIDVEQLMNEFYDELLQELKTSFPGRHTGGLERKHIVDLDSSTPQKFSRHWIVHLPSQALFVDTSQAGKFVKRFIQRLADEVATEQLKERRPHLQSYLFVNPKGILAKNNDNGSNAATINIPLSQKTCFVDLGVYTRNRLFRLLGCTKFGKSPDCALRIAEMNQFPFPKGFGNDQFYVPAMDMAKSQSTTQNSNSDSSDNEDNKNEDEEERDTLERFKVMTDWSPHAEALCMTLVVPMNGRKIDYPILPEIVDASDSKSIPDHFSAPTTTGGGKAFQKTYTFTCSGPSFGTSPYPSIDNFISNELASRGGVHGSIRSWTLDYGPEDSENGNNKRVPTSIAYQMSRNRWCECIGRSHKSNNILWRVSFQTKQCVQSCFDPDCRRMNFRGTPVDLPLDAAQQLEDALFEEAIGQMDDTELLAQSNPAAKKAPVDDNDNLGFDSADDAELEKAMMELNFGSPLAKKRLETSARNPCTVKTGDSGVAALSDDALLDAILQNPELFG